MSCMIVDFNSTAKLAHFITALCEHGFNYFGFSAPDLLAHEFADCRNNTAKAFERLVRYNYFAYHGRYGDARATLFPDMPPVSSPYHVRKHKTIDADNGFKKGYTVIEPWHYQIYKTLQCYLYQIEEDATYHTDLYKALSELESTMATFIASNQPDYIAAKWG